MPMMCHNQFTKFSYWIILSWILYSNYHIHRQIMKNEKEYSFLWWFFMFYVLVFNIFVMLAPYVCFHIFS